VSPRVVCPFCPVLPSLEACACGRCSAPLVTCPCLLCCQASARARPVWQCAIYISAAGLGMWRACVCGSGDCVGVVRGGHGVAWGLCLHCVAADGGGSCVGGTGGTIYIPPSLPCTCCNSVGAPVSGFPLSLLPGCRRRGADCSHSAIRWCCGCSGRAMRSHAQAPLHPCVKSFQHGSSRRRINETHALHTQTELQGSRWGERLVASALRQGASTAPLESSPSTPAILVYHFATPAATHTLTHRPH